MLSLRVISRWSGLLAILGSSLWIVSGSLLALRPAASVPVTRRPEEDLLPWLGLSLLFILPSLTAFHYLRFRHFSRWEKWAALPAAVGGVPYLVGVLSFLLGFVGRWIFVFTVPFLSFALSFSLLLIGWATLRASQLSRWFAVMLITSSLILLGFDTQDARAWLAVPFGIIWIILGYCLWSAKGLNAVVHDSSLTKSDP